MRVRILAFATAAGELGAAEDDLELPEGATIATLRRELVARQSRFAVNVSSKAWHFAKQIV